MDISRSLSFLLLAGRFIFISNKSQLAFFTQTMPEHISIVPLEVSDLIRRKLAGLLSAEEEIQLEQWRMASAKNEALLAELLDSACLERDIALRQQTDTSGPFQLLLQRNKEQKRRSAIRVIYRIAIAAIILALLATTLWFLFSSDKARRNKVSIRPVAGKITPPGKNAYLTLSDNQVVSLDQNTDTSIGTGNIRIASGAVQVQGTGAITYNTLNTPNGGGYRLQLEDGTGVWLNAASSIRFPSRFDGDSRNIVLNGEAYFEVTKDERRPFTISVTTNGTVVKVLGTSFNIKGYREDSAVYTTLVSGAVSVLSGTAQVKLDPGITAVSKESRVSTSRGNLGQVLAWRSNRFVFKDAALPELINEMQRWYDVRIELSSKEGQATFTGELSRDEPVEKLLVMLEKTGIISKFEITGRTIKVQP